MLAQGQRLTLQLMQEKLGISKDTVRTIVHEDLGKGKICSRLVPHKLTDEQKAKRMENSEDFITMCDQDPGYILSANHRHRGGGLVLPIPIRIQAAINGIWRLLTSFYFPT